METTSADYLIACVIAESERMDESIWFNRLESVLGPMLSRETISKNLDKLFDYGIVNGIWTDVDGIWVRTLHISDQATTLVSKITEQNADNLDVSEAYDRLRKLSKDGLDGCIMAEETTSGFDGDQADPPQTYDAEV